MFIFQSFLKLLQVTAFHHPMLKANLRHIDFQPHLLFDDSANLPALVTQAGFHTLRANIWFSRPLPVLYSLNQISIAVQQYTPGLNYYLHFHLSSVFVYF